MKSSMATALAAGLLAAAPASAQVLDLSTITCQRFIDYDKDNIGVIMMWMDGYFSDENAPPVIDFGRMKTRAEKLAQYCVRNPTIGLITAAEPIMEAK